MKSNKFPAGWDEDRVKQLLARYEEQTEEEAIAEDEAGSRDGSAAPPCTACSRTDRKAPAVGH